MVLILLLAIYVGLYVDKYIGLLILVVWLTTLQTEGFELKNESQKSLIRSVLSPAEYQIFNTQSPSIVSFENFHEIIYGGLGGIGKSITQRIDVYDKKIAENINENDRVILKNMRDAAVAYKNANPQLADKTLSDSEVKKLGLRSMTEDDIDKELNNAIDGMLDNKNADRMASSKQSFLFLTTEKTRRELEPSIRSQIEESMGSIKSASPVVEYAPISAPPKQAPKKKSFFSFW